MNITKLITGLQNAANTNLSSLQLAALSKAVQKLNVGAIQSIANASVFSASSSTAGDLFYSQADQEIYYNNNAGLFPLSGVGYSIAYAWGGNDAAALGDGTTTSRSSPVTVVGGIITWTQVSTFYQHALGITTSGVTYAWGKNTSGQLGDNTAVSKLSPVTVVGGITNWSQVSAGMYWSLGLTSSGIAYAWGSNGNGRLGDNTTTQRSSPVTVVGGLTTWSNISASVRDHSLGIANGIAYGWGINGSGQLGDNTTTQRSSPVTVVGGITTWSQLSGGALHSIGRTSTGIAYAWGYGYQGQLGNNARTDRSSPVTVVGGITSWSQISAGGKTNTGQAHNLGLTSTGIAYAWGYSGAGQIGDNTATARSSPVTVVGGITNWIELSAGSEHSLGRTSTGIAYAWGSNGNGRLGDNTTTQRSSPVIVVGGITGWSQVDAGLNASAAVRTIT
jgi:alpha-tubulin suppressor-like RCC1 family protein